MELKVETPYSVGDVLYYLEGTIIKTRTIMGIKALLREGSYFGKSSPRVEVQYYLSGNPEYNGLMQDHLDKFYFRSKTDILKHIADQL